MLGGAGPPPRPPQLIGCAARRIVLRRAGRYRAQRRASRPCARIASLNLAGHIAPVTGHPLSLARAGRRACASALGPRMRSRRCGKIARSARRLRSALSLGGSLLLPQVRRAPHHSARLPLLPPPRSLRARGRTRPGPGTALSLSSTIARARPAPRPSRAPWRHVSNFLLETAPIRATMPPRSGHSSRAKPHRAGHPISGYMSKNASID